jgi:hypothetical protein
MGRKVLRKYSIAGVNARSRLGRIETTMLAETGHPDSPYPFFQQSTLEDFLLVSRSGHSQGATSMGRYGSLKHTPCVSNTQCIHVRTGDTESVWMLAVRKQRYAKHTACCMHCAGSCSCLLEINVSNQRQLSDASFILRIHRGPFCGPFHHLLLHDAEILRIMPPGFVTVQRIPRLAYRPWRGQRENLER